MKNKELTITVASSVDAEELATELWLGDVMWGEIKILDARPHLVIYPPPLEKQWVFPLEELKVLLEQAEQIALNKSI